MSSIRFLGSERYKKVVSTAWVDEGENDVLRGYHYIVWYRWSGLTWKGPLDAGDAPVTGPNGHPVNNLTFEGEVVNPDLMDTEDWDGDV